MKPLFTIHAGEYLVGSHIEKYYPRWNVWLPSKDTGIDLLITNPRNKKSVSLQVKHSKDFNPTNRPTLIQEKLTAKGWWTHKELKIKNSPADFWIFVLPSYSEHETNFVIIKPYELLRRLKRIHGQRDRIHSYLMITKSKRCWEGRGLRSAAQDKIAIDQFKNAARDFSQFLNAWGMLEQKLR